MNLHDALAYISGHLLAHGAPIDADTLVSYADEDREGGRNAGYDDWSIDPDEGKLLYALVRALKPAQVLEIGVREGASTAHLLAALDANEAGYLDSIDIEAIPAKRTQANWTLHRGDALTVELPTADFIFEDSNHGLDYSLKLYERLRENAPRIVIVHDYAMTESHGDFHVREAFDTVFPDGFPITLDGCERGLAVWINPDWKADEVVTETVTEVAKPAPVKRVAKPRSKRTATRK